MSNAINPNDYNIDNFNSQNLGPINVTDFRTYVFNHNLQNVNPEIQNAGYSFYPRGVFSSDLWLSTPTVQDLPNLTEVAFTPSDLNNQTSPRPYNIKHNLWTHNEPFYGSPTNEEEIIINAKALEDPGSIDLWYDGSGFNTEVSTIRNVINLSNNEYGPEFINTYNGFNNPVETTGYNQYPTNNGTADILGQIVGRTLGFSTTNFIKFPSELQDVAQERRVTELKNRIKLNFIDDTAGSINLDPLGLLAGQQLFTPNYAITRPKGFLGKVAEFTANLAGFNVPISIIPGGKNVKLGSNAFQEDLIDYTGKGQRDLLYANVYSSKYSPELLSKGFDPENEEDNSKVLGKVGAFFGNLSKQTADNYLKLSKKDANEEKTLAQKIGGTINGLIAPQGDESLRPSPEKSVSPVNPFVSMGIEGQYPSIQSLGPDSKFNFIELDSPLYNIYGASADYQPNSTTLVPTLADSDNPNSVLSHQTPSTKELFDWRNRDKEIASRGLLKFTQDMVNSAEVNGHKGAAQYIGRFNSDSNIVQGQKDIGGDVTPVPRHKDVSMGNLVRNDSDEYFCRSWSTRNPYQNHYDLIRNDRLYRGKFVNNLSVLEDSGHVKIAPYANDASSSILENKESEIKRQMFSIENLAWIDAPEKIGLEPCEVGPNGGRIMWFPPYDINFTDNTSVSWEQNVFIGRAEPIYTYNHTDRKGTLSFSIITDHPSVINQMKKEDERTLYKFFAGCGVNVEKFFGREVVTQLQEEEVIEATPEIPPVIEETTPLPEIKPAEPQDPIIKTLECFFRNARHSELVGGVRKGVGRDIEEELAVSYELDDNWKTNKGAVLKLNEPFDAKVDELIDFLASTEGQEWGAEFIGYTSAASPKAYNKVLSIDRAQGVFRYITSKVKEKGETGGTGFTYNATNFGSRATGYVCLDTQERCVKAIENSNTLDIDDLNIKFTNPTLDAPMKRWVIKALSEGFSQQVDEDGNPIAEENAVFGDSKPTSEAAKRDRKVKIKLFKNEEYILNNMVIKMEPKKAEMIATEPLDRELAGFTNEPPIKYTIVHNNSPVTDKLGTEPSFTIVTNESKVNEAKLFASNVGKAGEGGSTLGEKAIDEEISNEADLAKKAVTLTVEKLFNECSYFEKIEQSDPFVYKTINEKIKHFHPAFHSMTPEGFNNRLTFLQQCTRQGPNIREDDNQTQNMAFGRPPICVLRIGDFYYTKIVIDSVNITYEPLQWDMNPEGIGVQPQIAKIDLNFSFIGGSSMSGPIRQLQNAVSFNYFANTAIYNPRRIFTEGDNKQYKTLEELLVNSQDTDANGNFISKEKSVGYGSFKSQEGADRRVIQTALVSTGNDSQDQTNTINERDTGGGDVDRLPTVPLIDIGQIDTDSGDRDILPFTPSLIDQNTINEWYRPLQDDTGSGDIPIDDIPIDDLVA